MINFKIGVFEMKPLIILDLEATCSENKDIEAEIIEIGAVKIIDGKIVDSFDAFVKPVINPTLTDFCKTLTTITQEDVDSAKSFPDVFRDFMDWIGTTHFDYMSWGFYDKKQFIHHCKYHNLPYAWTENHDNIKLMFANKTGHKPCGMDKALRILNLPLDGTHHRGIDDAKNIAKIYLKINE